MIYVENANYDNHKKLMAPDSPSYSGILSGKCKGQVWVDNIINPELAMVYSAAVGGYAILGHPSNPKVYKEFINFLDREFFKSLKDKGINDFEFSVESKILEGLMLEYFSDKSIESEEEYYYRYLKGDQAFSLDDKDIYRVDGGFLKALDGDIYGCPDFIKKRLLESFHDDQQFLKNSLAYVCIKEGHLVGVILGSGRYENLLSIDIETKASFQKQGIAYNLTLSFLRTCQDLGLTAQWNCTASNIGSQKTAEKSGFQLFKKDKFYWFTI